ncbi:MAG TPA: hypothetical protein VF666_21760 [Pyrinomonadaceae bacterium]
MRDSLRAMTLGGRARLMFLLRVVLCTMLAASVVIGCGWVGTRHSVRFNGWLTERQMARLPPMPTKDSQLPLEPQETSAARRDEDETTYEMAQQRSDEIDALWGNAEASTARGDLNAARQQLSEYLARTKFVHDEWLNLKDRQARRNSAADQLDALAALDKGASAKAVASYLAARRAYDLWMNDDTTAAVEDNAQTTDASATHASARDESMTGELRPLLEDVARERNLEDNVAYLRAAILYREGKMTEASAAFGAVAGRFPRSEKREAALFMAAVTMMKTSRSFTGTSGDSQHLRELNRPVSQDGNEAPAVDDEMNNAPPKDNNSESPDQAWHAAREGFVRVMREFPRGRYTSDARGWHAYLLLRAGDRAGALIEYYRLLGNEPDAGARAEGAFSLRLTRHHASEDEMRRVEAELEDEPTPALAYAYHNIYNYALNPACELNDDYYGYVGNDWESQRAQSKRDERIRREKERIVAFATRMLRRYPRAGAGAAFALRVAEANLELDKNKEALEQSKRALSLGLPRDEGLQALWVKGIAEHRTRDYAAARATLGLLLSKEPRGELVEGTRAFLAMAAEDAGDLEAALEQYLALDYTNDVAYFIDALLTPEQLQNFIVRHPRTPKRDELLYALGVRYMRLGRYDEARAAYAQVRTTEPNDPNYFLNNDGCLDDESLGSARRLYRCIDPKNPYDAYQELAGVRVRWVARDLKTIDDLERLEGDAATAQGDEAKAESLYQLASYIYQSGDLAFYNPAAWRGNRYYALNYDQKFRAPDEARIMRQYMEQHDPLVRALEIYQRLARTFPQTRAARDALYTAAVIHERLQRSYVYWPEQYSQGLHAGEALVTYADVRRIYPRYQLPRGVRGWEPLTRTVNGGPGWTTAPKAKPLTPTERIRRRVKRAERIVSKGWHLFGEIGGGSLRRWSFVGFSSLGLLFVFRLTRRTRNLLFEQLTRRTREELSSRREPLPMSVSSYGAQEPYTFNARARRLTHHAAQELWRLTLDGRGRSALALNLLTHGLLTVLLWTLTWALKQG